MDRFSVELISAPDLRVFVVDNILDNDMLIDIEDKCPNIDDFELGVLDEKIYYITNTNVKDLGLPYDYLNVPTTESYFNEGVVVNPFTDIPEYFSSNEWKKTIGDIIDADYTKMGNNLWQYRTNLKNTNGLWLHSDKNVYPGQYERNIEVLIYPNNEEWKEEYGGELLLFSNKKSIDNIDRDCVDVWQTKRELFELDKLKVGDIIRTKGVAGGWNLKTEAVDFKLERKIEPLFGRVVIFDYRKHYNVHAVSPKNTFNRKSIESWFTYGSRIDYV